MTATVYPAQPAAIASAGCELAREFTAWQIDFRPGALDVVTAFWCSPDGRSRRYVVRSSSVELLARLREIEADPRAAIRVFTQPGNEDPCPTPSLCASNTATC